MPSSRSDGIPPMKDNAGAYYYKYSYSWTSKSASTEVNLVDADLKRILPKTIMVIFFYHVWVPHHLRLNLVYLLHTNYTATSTAWVPGENNSATYYGLLCRPEYISYNRFGSTDEEISIDYT